MIRLTLLLLSFIIANIILGQDATAVADSLIAKFPTMKESDKSAAFINTNSKFIQGDVEASLSFIAKIETYALQASDTILLINSQLLTAEYYWRKGDYRKAIEFALEAVEYASGNERFKEEEGRGYQTAGTIHLYLLNADEALNYYREAIKIYQKTNQFTSLAGTLNNTGVVYMDAADEEDNPAFLDSALHYFQMVVEMEGQALPRAVRSAVGNMGAISVIKEDWLAADRYNKKWEALEADSPSPRARSMNYGTIGLTHMRQGRLDQANNYLTEGLKISEELGSKYEMQEYYLYLSELMELTRDYESALSYSKKGWALKDSIYNIEKVEAINELEAKYQNEKKQREIERVNAELDKKQRLQTFLLILICVSVVAFFLVIQRFKLKKALLSQEIDTLRSRIKSVLKGEAKDFKINRVKLNKLAITPLSDREVEILQFAMTDLTNSEIAEKAFVSVNTVKFHLKNIYGKLGVGHTREELQIALQSSKVTE